MKNDSHTATNLVRLVYASEKSPECAIQDLREILETARSHNRGAGITGFLCFSGDRFLQAIEGPPKAVNELYASILKDKRHHRVQLLDYRNVAHREFPQWEMGYAHSLDPHSEVLGAHFGKHAFAPHELTGIEALDLLRILANSTRPGEVPPDRERFEVESSANSA